MPITKSGMFAVIGRPNVGKSTLVNALVGEKVAIVSNKPQTTRHRVMAVINRDDRQYVFVDTPGFHKPKTRLGDFMVSIVKETVSDTDAVILVVEPRPAGVPERMLIENIRLSSLPCILIINKIDTLPREELLPVIMEYSGLFDFKAIIPLSALKNDGTDILLRELDDFLIPGDSLFPDDVTSDQPERVIAAECVREKLLWRLQQEIPHGVAVLIERYERGENDVLYIDATIFVERKSHKSIVIGQNGSMLRDIGTMAREELEQRLDTRIHLELWVKVKEGWRDSLYQLKNFGYEN